MNVLQHYEHAASVEGYGIEGDGEGMSYVPTTQLSERKLRKIAA